MATPNRLLDNWKSYSLLSKITIMRNGTRCFPRTQNGLQIGRSLHKILLRDITWSPLTLRPFNPWHQRNYAERYPEKTDWPLTDPTMLLNIHRVAHFIQICQGTSARIQCYSTSSPALLLLLQLIIPCTSAWFPTGHIRWESDGGCVDWRPILPDAEVLTYVKLCSALN